MSLLKLFFVTLVMLSTRPVFANCQDDHGAEGHSSADHGSHGHYGVAVPDKAGLSLAQATSQFNAKSAKPVVIEGVATQVCKNKGCWMVLKDGNTEIRAVMKDHGFSVPQELIGKKVRAVGHLTRKEISAAQRRHFAKDGGAKPEEVQKITTSEWTYQFTADGVQVL